MKVDRLAGVQSRIIDSPIGKLFVEASDQGVTRVMFQDKMDSVPEPSTGKNKILDRACVQLEEYFSGIRTEFDLPLAARGTKFQKQVWGALCEVPYGSHCSYSALAQTIQNPKAVRAVGAANGRNPIWVIVPCHRIIGKDGSLTGYAGGIERKRWLLALEKRASSLMKK